MNDRERDCATYVENAAWLMKLSLTPESLAGVIENFEGLIKVASLVNEFTLPEDIEIAPIFEP